MSIDPSDGTLHFAGMKLRGVLEEALAHGGTRYGCGGALCTGCARHALSSIDLGQIRFACVHVAKGGSTGAELLLEAEGPCRRCGERGGGS